MKLKPGDKVRFIDGESHETMPEYYPKVRTVGEVVRVNKNDETVLVQWPVGKTSVDDRWWCSYEQVVKVKEGGRKMNCSKCGKKLVAGMTICLTCEKDLQKVPDKNTRLGYYARHPEALAALLIDIGDDSNEFGLKVCHRDCVPKHELENVDCTDEKLTACIVRWLLEPMEEGEV